MQEYNITNTTELLKFIESESFKSNYNSIIIELENKLNKLENITLNILDSLDNSFETQKEAIIKEIEELRQNKLYVFYQQVQSLGVDVYGDTRLHKAIKQNYESAHIKLIISETPAIFYNLKNNEEKTPLSLLESSPYFTEIKDLLNNNEPNINISDVLEVNSEQDPNSKISEILGANEDQ